jgi:hypothetical protein
MVYVHNVSPIHKLKRTVKVVVMIIVNTMNSFARMENAKTVFLTLR